MIATVEAIRLPLRPQPHHDVEPPPELPPLEPLELDELDELDEEDDDPELLLLDDPHELLDPQELLLLARFFVTM
jgi:hypothetical protein